MGVQRDDQSGCGYRHKCIICLAQNAGARVPGIWPLGHPFQAQGGIKAVEIGQSRQQPVGMLADIIIHGAVMKLNHRRGEWGVPSGAVAIARDLAKGTVDYGQGVGGGGHG